MEDFKNKFLVLTFLLILSLPLYGWVVQVVNGLGPKDLTDSFVLESQRQAGASTIFQIGDTLVVAAESQLASTYMLDIYENSSLIIVKHGEFNEAQIEVEVLLSPQMFSAGHTYAAVFHVNSYNKFIPGTFFTDTVVSAFTVVSVDTKLGLTAEYSGLFSSLYLNANLTAVDGYPVANEKVDFFLQFDKGRSTEGWIPLGSAQTGLDGSAKLNLAVGLSDGDYHVKAFHEGNANYGESGNVTEIEVLSNATGDAMKTRYFRSESWGLYDMWANKLLFEEGNFLGQFQNCESGDLTVYWGSKVALLHMNGSLTYITSDQVAIVSRSVFGWGLQSATWECPETTLAVSDCLYIEVWVKFGDSWYSYWMWMTEALGTTKLDQATWTFYYYTFRDYLECVNLTIGDFQYGDSAHNSRIENIKYGISVGNLTLEVSSSNPYALLPTNATARYASDTPLPGPYHAMFFYLDFPAFAFAGLFAEAESGPPYIYETPLVWCPMAAGVHILIAGIASGDLDVLMEAHDYGAGLVATDEVILNVQRCPANIVLDHPKAAYGDSDVLPITAAVATPRPYEAQNNDFSITTTLAPRFLYNGVEYVIDEWASTVPLNFFVNDTLITAMRYTNMYGLANFELDLNFTSARIRVAIDDNSVLSLVAVEEVLSFRKIRVYDRPSAVNDPMAYVTSYLDEGSRYLGVGGSVYVSADDNANILAAYGGGAANKYFSFRKSTDGGLTWGSRVLIDPSIIGEYYGNTLNFYDSASKRIGVVYHDGFDDLGARYSADGGSTWSTKNVGRKGTMPFIYGTPVGSKILVEFCDYTASYYLYQMSYNIATDIWSTVTQITNFGKIYYARIFKDVNGRVHSAFCRYDTGLSKYCDIYYMYSDDQGSTWRDINGNILTLPIAMSSTARVYTGVDTSVSSVTADGTGKIYIVNGPNAKIYFWSGASWTMKTASISIDGKSGNLQDLIWHKGALRAVFSVWDGASTATRDFVYGHSQDDGDTWNRLTKITWDNIYDASLVMNNVIYNDEWYGAYVHGWTNAYGQDIYFLSLSVPAIVDLCGFNFTVRNGAENGKLFVGVDSRLEAEASLLNQSVWNLPVSVTYGKFVSGIQTDASGVAYIPAGTDYMRVLNTTVLWGDVNGDGVVDLDDISAVLSSHGAYPGHPQWNVDADLNHDNIVNMFDFFMVRDNIGEMGDYLFFDNGQTVYLDSKGFARIPAGATSLTMYRNGVPTANASIEFFKISLEKTLWTNNLGQIMETWVPSESGIYLAQVKVSSKFDVLSFTQSNVTGLDAQANLVDYFEVVKRPVYLSLSNSSNVSVGSPVDLIVDAVDGAIGESASSLPIQLFVNGESIGTVYTNSTGTALVSWTPSSNIVYNVVANYSGNSTHNGASAALRLDLRKPTNLRLWLMGEKVESATTKPMVWQDAFVTGISPDSNFGEQGALWVSNEIPYRSWLKFSLPTLPPSASITTAKVWLHTTDRIGTPVSARFSSTDSWDESGITWNNQPNYDSIDLDVVTPTSGFSWYSWTVTSTVQQELAGDKTVTFVMLPSSSSGFTTFYSGDSQFGSYPPYLEIAYTYLTYYPAQEIEDNGTINVGTFVDNRFYVEGLPVSGGDETVNVSVNSKLYKTVTTRTGDAVFDWRAESTGAYFLNVSYTGNSNYKPDDFNFAAIARASPVSLNFDVNPTEFEMGDTVDLWAKAINPLNNQSLSGVQVGFWQDGYGYGTLVGGQYHYTDGNGVATANWVYPTDGSAHTIVAKVKEGQALANVTLSMRPVTLTVGTETKLWLSVERCSTNTEHTVYARLIRARDSTPIADQLIKLDVNGTVYTLTTNSTGYVRQALKLETIGGQATTYQVKATFEGTNPQTRSLEVTDPYGKEYAVCTTIQYGYKPSSNSASLTVEPPKTDVTAPAGNEPPTQSPEGTTVSIPPPKTPEQLQQEAEQSGALTVWHEFTWWYPWYRLHIKIHVNPTIDIGFNPILPGGEVADWSGLEFFGALVGEVLEETLIEAFALIGAYLVARTIGIAQPWIGVAIEAGKISAQALLFLSDWDDALRMLAAGLVSIAMSFFAIVNFYVQPNIFMKFVDALWSLCGSAQGALRWMLMRLTEMALLGKAVSRSWMDAVEATADFVIGLTALLRYVDLTT